MNLTAKISHTLAADLKAAGLEWTPQLYDFFTIPDTAFEDGSFVLTDVMASMTVLKGHPAISFNGVVEWALDFVFQQEALWLPTEAQLRHQLEIHTAADILLRCTADQYHCEVVLDGAPRIFTAVTACDAYGRALLSLLEGR